MKKQYTSVTLAVLLALTSTSQAIGGYYGGQVPSASTGSMYYALGGGNTIPDPPSNTDHVSAGFKGTLGGIFNCGSGTFDPKASLTNSLNGIKNSFTNMFNDAVSNAKGAVMEMPAYLIARASPALYQLLQNGFQSGRWSFGLGVKSCSDVQNDIDTGKDPIKGFAHTSTKSGWLNNMMDSESYGFQSQNGLTYEAAEHTDINSAKEKVDEDKGKDGAAWVSGVDKDGTKYAGGQNQPVIKLTHDVVLAGANAMIGKTQYNKSENFPDSSALKVYWGNSEQMAQWAVDVLGERVITTYQGGDKTATPGRGLLAKVQVMFTGSNQDGVYQKLIDLVSGQTQESVKSLQAVSTTSVIINKAIINDIRHEPNDRQMLSINVLAQGIASGRVIDQAQMLKEVLQTAEQVPAIARNVAAQAQIQKYIATLKDQINLVVNYRETNKKLITSSIQTIVKEQASTKNAKSHNRPTATASPIDVNQLDKKD